MRRKTTVVLADEEMLFREAPIARCEGVYLCRVVGYCGDGMTAASLIKTLALDGTILDVGLPCLCALSAIRRTPVDPARRDSCRRKPPLAAA